MDDVPVCRYLLGRWRRLRTNSSSRQTEISFQCNGGATPRWPCLCRGLVNVQNGRSTAWDLDETLRDMQPVSAVWGRVRSESGLKANEWVGRCESSQRCLQVSDCVVIPADRLAAEVRPVGYCPPHCPQGGKNAPEANRPDHQRPFDAAADDIPFAKEGANRIARAAELLRYSFRSPASYHSQDFFPRAYLLNPHRSRQCRLR